MIKRSDLQPNPKGLAVALYLYDINNSLPEGSDLDKEDQTVELLNSGANSAKMSFEPVLPENPLADTIKPNLNTNLSQVLAVYNGNTGSLDADYAYGLERISVHNEDTSTGKVQDPLYYLYDGIGRVTELTKPTAQVSDKYRFDAFGVELPGGKMSPNAYKNLNNPFGYNGEQYDPEAGLSYMRNRYYEPDTGRFMNRDLLPGRISEPLSLNAYAYVTNNPLKYMDPLGLDKYKESQNSWLWNHTVSLIGGKPDANGRTWDQRFGAWLDDFFVKDLRGEAFVGGFNGPSFNLEDKRFQLVEGGASLLRFINDKWGVNVLGIKTDIGLNLSDKKGSAEAIAYLNEGTYKMEKIDFNIPFFNTSFTVELTGDLGTVGGGGGFDIENKKIWAGIHDFYGGDIVIIWK